MKNNTSSYNLLLLDDALQSFEIGLMSGVILWLNEVYGKHINIHQAKDIREALKVVSNMDKLDVLITDMNLPYHGIPPEKIDKYRSGKLGGIYFIDEILKIYPLTKIVVVSGWDFDEYKHMLDERVSIALSKPYTLTYLENILDTLLQEVTGIETRTSWEERNNPSKST